MTATNNSIRTSAELALGDSIEAWHNGRLYHRGTVVKKVAATELFWIEETATGRRRLLDMDSVEIVRIPQAPQTQPPAQPKAAAPSFSPYPLFQDGTKLQEELQLRGGSRLHGGTQAIA